VIGANIIAIADVNGDGANDLVITDPGPTGGMAPTVNILLQNPAGLGTFLAPVKLPDCTLDLSQSIVVKDVDGDGRPDYRHRRTADRHGAAADSRAGRTGTFMAATRNNPAPGAYRDRGGGRQWRRQA